jgi:ubiquinone/menaquinone biosynthesis C-methylase UbiE
MSIENIDDKQISHFDEISGRYYDIVDRVWYDYGYYHVREKEIILEEITKGCGSKRDVKILDAGCGPGRNSIGLAKRGYSIIALDFSEGMLNETGKLAKQMKLEHNIQLIRGDVRHLPFKDSIFDYIINMEVMEHLENGLEDGHKMIKEFYRVSSDIQGKLIFETPNKIHFIFYLVPLCSPSRKEITKEEIRKLYEDNPLVVANSFIEYKINNIIKSNEFHVINKKFIRVIPSGIIERLELATKLDNLLEEMPIIRNLSREIVWICQKKRL